MSSSWTRAIGLSLIVCLIAILAAPALAADPFHGRSAVFPSYRGRGMALNSGKGMTIISSLQLMAYPVVGPLAALTYAERAAQRFIFPSRAGTAMGFPGSRSKGLSWAFNRSTIPVYPAARGASGTMAAGLAENLTAYLGGKGYDVTDMNAALTDARTALASSNLTTFGSAMRSFRKDLDAKIVTGTINRSVISDFLKTLPAPQPVAGWGTRGGRVRMPAGRGR